MPAGAAPSYGNVRWGGTTGLRVPQEVGPATFMVKKEVDIDIGGAGTTNTINLSPNQQLASYYTFKNSGSGATTVNFPVCSPGLVFGVYNASAQNLIVKVAGKTGVTIATTKRAMLAMDNSITVPDVVRLSADV